MYSPLEVLKDVGELNGEKEGIELMSMVGRQICVERRAATPVAQYSIWSMTSGILPSWPKSLSYVWDYANAGTITIPLSYNLIVGGGRIVLFDTGWEDPETLKTDGVAHWEPIIAQLGRLGVKPDDIDTIVVSHMHLDHAGQIKRFPKASILLQKAEMDFIDFGSRHTSGVTKDRCVRYYFPADVETLRVADREGRLVLVDGYYDVAPGLKIVPALDTHTAGSQMLLVNTVAGQMVITGDAASSRSSILQGIPMATGMGSNFESLLNFERILELTRGKIEMVVGSHDPDHFSYWPSWTLGETKIAEIALAPGQSSLRPR